MTRSRPTLRALLLMILACTAPGDAQERSQIPDTLVSRVFFYTVQPGDSLTSIGARFGVAPGVLARENGLQPSSRLKSGQELRVDNRHIVPLGLQDGILINLPQRLLFYFVQGTLATSYPVGLGRPDWPTPVGPFMILSTVRTRVPPGPDNPLGQYWLGLSLAGYGIHGTIAPASIYQFRSHGCIRLHPDDIVDLFSRVSIGTPGIIIYAPVLLAQVNGNQIYLEVHRDVYRCGGEPLAAVQRLSVAVGLGPRLDWQRVEEVVRLKDGVAREVSWQPRRSLD